MFIANVRFAAHYGLKPDSAPSPKIATNGHCAYASNSEAIGGVIRRSGKGTEPPA
jgi:hypothetical protein